MTALDVARKDFEDAVQSRAIWFASGLFLLVLVLGVSVPALVFEEPSAETLLPFLLSPATNLVLPVLAVMLGYRSIVGERERGSVRFLLALPHSRWDVVLGKLLGRSAVLAVAVVGGVVTTTGLLLAGYGAPPLFPVVAFALSTLLAGTAFVAIAVGVSASVSTGTRSISVLVGGFVLATSLWERIPPGVYYLLVGEFPGSDPPWWVRLATQLNPLEAYGTVASAVLPETSGISIAVDDSGIATARGVVAATPDSVFYEPGFVVAVLVGWIAVPITIGYLRFRRADLV